MSGFGLLKSGNPSSDIMPFYGPERGRCHILKTIEDI